MFFRCKAKSYKAEAKSIIRQSQQDFFRWEADIIIKQADITFRVLKKKQKKIPSDFRRKSLFANRENEISNSYKHMACDSPPFRHYQSLDDGSLYVHLARALTWDNTDIISSPVDGEFQSGILSIQHPAAWQCLGVRERMVKPESSGIDSKRGDLLSEIFIETTRFHTAKPKVKRTTPRGLRGLLSGYNV